MHFSKIITVILAIFVVIAAKDSKIFNDYPDDEFYFEQIKKSNTVLLNSMKIQTTNANTTLIGRSPYGPCNFVKKDDMGRIFIANGGALEILTIDSMNSIKKLSEYDTYSTIKDLFINNNLLYIANSKEGLLILDISDLYNVNEIARYDTPGRAMGVVYDSSIIYLSDALEGIKIFNVQDPNNPILINSVDLGLFCNKLVIKNKTLFVGTSKGLRILDVTDYNNVQIIGSYSTWDDIKGFVIKNNIAYLAVDRQGVILIDISNPRNPTFINSIGVRDRARGLDLLDSYLYVADAFSGLTVVDVNDIYSLNYASFLNTPGYAYAVDVEPGRCYVADFEGGLNVIDITQPTTPITINTYETNGRVQSIYVQENYLYVTERFNGLRIISFDDPSNLVNVSFIETPNDAISVCLNDSLAFVADGQGGGLQIINIKNKEFPFKIGEFPSASGYAHGVFYKNGNVFLADGYVGLRIIDVTNPTSPVQIGYYDTPGFSYGVFATDSLALVADGNGGLRILDIKNLNKIQEIGIYTPGDYVLDVVARNNYAFLANSYLGLKILDISDPTNPIEISSLSTTYRAIRLSLNGDFLYIADGFGGVRIIDISDPHNPIETGYFDTGDQAGGVFGVKNLFYIADQDNGFYVVRNDLIPDTTAPVIFASLDTLEVKGDNKVTYIINFSATDDYDTNPKIKGVIKTPYIENPEEKFKTKKKYKLKYNLKKKEVKIEGPEPEDFWEQIKEDSGIEVYNGQVIDMKFKHESNKFEYKFDENNNLKEVEGNYIILQCIAEDYSGNIDTTEVAIYFDDNNENDDKKEHGSTLAESGEIRLRDFKLYQNYPNPFNPGTYINFILSKNSWVKLEIYNVSGQKIKTLVDNFLVKGQYTIFWNGSDNRGNLVPSGIYFYKLEVGNESEVRKMVLRK